MTEKIIISVLVVVLVSISTFQVNILVNKYKSECLKSLRYFFIIFSIFLTYTMLGCYVSALIKQHINTDDNIIEVVAYFIPFIGIPFIITAWYMLLSFAIEFTSIKIGDLYRYLYFPINIIIFFIYAFICNIWYDESEITFRIVSDNIVKVLLVYSSIIYLLFNFIIGYSLVFNTIKKGVARVATIFLLGIVIFLTVFGFSFVEISVNCLITISVIAAISHFLMVLILKKYYKKFGNNIQLNENSDNNSKFFEEYGISAREQEITELICEGKTNKEIAEQLFITLQTVKDHTHRIYTKVGVKSRVQLINMIKNR